MNDALIYAIGFGAQLLFSSRMVVQWVLSERAQKVLSPTLFWQLSLIASFLMIGYGILRKDVVIIGGQLIGYFIYIRTLQFKGFWPRLPAVLRYLAIVYPLAATGWLLFAGSYNLGDLLNNADISRNLLLWGAVGQAIFSTRFVYQWYFSEKKKISALPAGFWMISLIGASMMLLYGFFRQDWPLLLGQCFGLITYSRNWYLLVKRGRKLKQVKEGRPSAS
ncbi:MAG: lipid-A-disaccharide synthase N-terminal domain-containing protein [Bacteroidota bacterium]